MRIHPVAVLSLALVVVALLALPAVVVGAPPGGAADATTAGADWPGHRGPDRDGISPETGWRKSFGEEGPPVLWRVPSGSGYSALTVADGTIFSMAGRDADELVVAWDAESGRELWTRRIDSVRRDQFGDGPRSTPLLHGGLLYAVGAKARLAALDPRTGEVRWARDLAADLGAKVPTWGVSASPIVEGGHLLLDVGSDEAQIAAFDPGTGETRWTLGPGGLPGYSTPIAFDLGGTRHIVFFTGRAVLAVDPAEREVLWTHPWRTSYDVNAATPIHLPPNRLFVSSGYDTGAAVLEIGADGRSVREVWASRRMKNQFSSSVATAGHVFGFDNRALKVLDLATGEQAWQNSGYGHGSLLLADGHLIVLGEKGELAIVRADPERYAETWSGQPLRGKHWTVPTLWKGRLFVRNETELIAFDLRPVASEPAPAGR